MRHTAVNRVNRVTRVTRQVVVATVVAAPLLALAAAPAQATPSASYSLKGVDVNRYQHPGGAAIDWKQVAGAGYSFALVEATQGGRKGLTNPYFTQDFADAKANGLVRGAFDYGEPGENGGATLAADAANEATASLQAIGGAMTHEADTMPLVLDLEERNGYSEADLASWARSYADTVKAMTGRLPVLYVSACFFTDGCMGPPASLSDLPLWVAQYTSASSPTPTRWSIWQWESAQQDVPGIASNVDHDVFSGSLAALDALGEGRTPAILAAYAAQGGASGPLGATTGDEKQIQAGVWEQDYADGVLVWSATTGAAPLTGTALTWFRAHPEIGLPTGPPVEVTGGTVQPFSVGDLSLAYDGTVETMMGPVRTAWRQALADPKTNGGLGTATMAVSGSGADQSQEFKRGEVVVSSGVATVSFFPTAMDGVHSVVQGAPLNAVGRTANAPSTILPKVNPPVTSPQVVAAQPITIVGRPAHG